MKTEGTGLNHTDDAEVQMKKTPKPTMQKCPTFSQEAHFMNTWIAKARLQALQNRTESDSD
eukprot:175256-Karenia_brevis.AAC.1